MINIFIDISLKSEYWASEKQLEDCNGTVMLYVYIVLLRVILKIAGRSYLWIVAIFISLHQYQITVSWERTKHKFVYLGSL